MYIRFQVSVSNVVAELCAGKRLPFQDVGEITLKGFDRPVRAHAVVWQDLGFIPALGDK